MLRRLIYKLKIKIFVQLMARDLSFLFGLVFLTVAPTFYLFRAVQLQAWVKVRI